MRLCLTWWLADIVSEKLEVELELREPIAQSGGRIGVCITNDISSGV